MQALSESDPVHLLKPLAAQALTAGKPTSMIIAEVADMYAFAAKCIGAQWIGKADN